MKKKLLCLLLALFCVLPLVLTGCAEEDDDVVDGVGTKPITLNLYGITNESTTEEAILKVQEKMNEYTEGKFNTHIVLHLYPEDEYYAVIDEKFAEIERLNAKDAAAEENPVATTEGKDEVPVTALIPETELETGENTEEPSIYPAESATQLDIFMVQGATNLNKYYEAGYLTSLSDFVNSNTGSAKILNDYISKNMLATATLKDKTRGGKDTLFGIPNNYVYGEYTYLLVNKEIATKYYYSAADVSTLNDLSYFLEDAYENHKDYITLYNEPTLAVEYFTETESLIGGIIGSDTNRLSRVVPRCLLGTTDFIKFNETLYNFRKSNYITKGDLYSLPVDEEGNPKKVAAAFIKGDAATPAEYEDEYFVITYAKPFANRNQHPGTMFCVSKYSMNAERSMEIIAELQIKAEFRNIFQYGVEGVNYTADEYTGVITYLNDTYSMNPEDTGNLFLLTPNTSMSNQMLKLSENNWALGKQQYRDTVTSPYSLFDFRIITESNYKTESLAYRAAYEAALNAAKDKAGKDFDESKFVFDEPYAYTYTDEILAKLDELSTEYLQRIEDFEEYKDEEGNTVTIKDFIKTLQKEFENNEYYKMFVDSENLDAPYVQYNNWCTANLPQ